MTLLPLLRRAALLVGLACLAGIAFATLSPIDLRPHVARMGVEHVGAFFVLALFLGIARPRRLAVVGLCLLVAAAGLEIAQHLVPGRHGRMVDFLMKAAGGGLGLAASAIVDHWLRRIEAGRAPRTENASPRSEVAASAE
jgi:hypothetical protein